MQGSVIKHTQSVVIPDSRLRERIIESQSLEGVGQLGGREAGTGIKGKPRTCKSSC